MLGARSRFRPLPLSLVGWCASCNNNDNNEDRQDIDSEPVTSIKRAGFHEMT